MAGCLPASFSAISSRSASASSLVLRLWKVQTSLKEPFRLQNMYGFNSWKLGAIER